MKEAQDNSNKSKAEPVKSLIYGFNKGVTTIAGYPLSVVRTRLYNDSAISFLKTFNTIKKAEGFLGFYQRGFSLTLLKMSAKEGYRGFGYEHFGHGMGSIVFNTLMDTLTSPLDQVKVLQHNAQKQQTITQTIKQIAEKGIFKESAKVAPAYAARQFGAYTCTIQFQKAADYILESYIYKGQPAPVSAQFAGSAAAGICVATLVNPLNAVITQLQLNLGGNKTASQVCKNIIKNHGAKGLLRGNPIGYVFAIMSQCSYSASKKWCERIDMQREEASASQKKI